MRVFPSLSWALINKLESILLRVFPFFTQGKENKTFVRINVRTHWDIVGSLNPPCHKRFFRPIEKVNCIGNNFSFYQISPFATKVHFSTKRSCWKKLPRLLIRFAGIWNCSLSGRRKRLDWAWKEYRKNRRCLNMNIIIASFLL